MTSERVPSSCILKPVLVVLAIAMHCLLGSAGASAQTASRGNAEPSLFNLAPAHTPSPRDTVATFLGAIEQFDISFDDPAAVELHYALMLEAAETMDFDATVNGKTPAIAVRYILLLDEILSRINLPPLSDIPGVADVAATGLTSWTIPGTHLQITQVTDGPRVGEFVFSAETVASLETSYNRVSRLGYKPGESGHLEVFNATPGNLLEREQAFASLLGDVDLSSPRSVFEGFLWNMNQSYELVESAREGLKADPPTLTDVEALKIEATARDFLMQAAATLDLSAVPEAQRDDIRVETALQLKEVFDRLPTFPFIDKVPDAAMIAEARDVPIGSAIGATIPFSWSIPRTDIVIAAVTEGPDFGNFLFTKETVARAPEFYKKLSALPYRETSGAISSHDYVSPNPSPGFYQHYITTPGYLLPEATPLGRLIETLPSELKYEYRDQTLWQWIGLVLLGLGTILLTVVIFRVVGMAARAFSTPRREWISIVAPVLCSMAVIRAFDICNDVLNLTGSVLTVIRITSMLVELGFVIAAIWLLFSAVAATVISWTISGGRGIDASLVRILSATVGFVVSLVLVVQTLRELGADLVPILAGLGVGGLAAALAIRPTLENLIGGIILYVDKPVRVGDFCKFGGFSGTIEQIGIRSTLLRGLDRTMIAVPNAKLVDLEITNFALCDQMMINFSFGLRYETQPDQLRYLLARIREMLHSHPMIDRKTVRVRFVGFGDSALDIDLRVYAKTREWNDFYAVREDLLLRISEIVTEAGSSIAFPSQTLYMARDSGVDPAQGAKAEAEVAKWRKKGELPFPSMRSSRIDELEDTLDYPPKGSTDAIFTEASEHMSQEPLSTDAERALDEDEETLLKDLDQRGKAT